MSKRIPKTGLTKPVSSNNTQSILPMPSKTDCGECCKNMNNESYHNSIINESLSSKVKIINFDKQIYKYERIQNDAITNHVINLKKLRQIEVDKVEQIEATRAKRSKNNKASENEQNKAPERTTFLSKKGAFVKNAAHYYFNINNPFGLHLSVEQIHHIANMLCANFKAVNGSFLDPRQTLSGLKMGFNMNQKGEIVLK